MIDQKQIASEYGDFFAHANELADKDNAKYPLSKHESNRERFEKHLLGMIEMYSIRYGDPDQRLRIVEYIDKNLFPDDKSSEVYTSWGNIRKAILSGEYHDETL